MKIGNRRAAVTNDLFPTPSSQGADDGAKPVEIVREAQMRESGIFAKAGKGACRLSAHSSKSEYLVERILSGKMSTGVLLLHAYKMKSKKISPASGTVRFPRFTVNSLRLCGALIPALACGSVAWAGDVSRESSEKEEKVTQLPPTVVVASRTEIELDKVAPSVSVISSETLVAEQISTVAEALVSQPGIIVYGSANTGAPTTISIRGTNSQDTVIMLDGRRMNGGIYGQYGIGTLTTANLADIQILRGSASTLYGSAAIGGAIDLRTKSGLDSEAPTGSILVEGGSWGTRSASLEFAGNSDYGQSSLPAGLGISAGFFYAASDGYNWNNGYENTDFLPRFDWRVNDKLTINLVARFFQKNYGCPNSKFSKSYTDRQKDSGWMLSPEIVFTPTENLTGKVLYSYSEFESEGYVGGLIDNENKAQQISTQWDWRAFENFEISFGYDFIQDDAFGRGEPSWGGVPASLLQYSNSVWTNARWEILKNLWVTGGVRYTDTNKYGERTTYELSAQYRIESTGTGFFGKISTGFRVPSYMDLSPNWKNIPDNTLEAEKSVSYEIGVRQELFDAQLKLEATLFLIDTKDKFVSDYSVYPAVVRNVDEALSNGIEISANWTPDAVDGLRVYGSATFQDAWDRKTDARMKLIPQFAGTIGAEYVFAEDFTLGASGTFVKGREGGLPVYPYSQADMEDYFVARIYGNWIAMRYKDGREKCTLFARIENVLDREYDDYNIGYEAARIGVFAGTKFSF